MRQLQAELEDFLLLAEPWDAIARRLVALELPSTLAVHLQQRWTALEHDIAWTAASPTQALSAFLHAPLVAPSRPYMAVAVGKVEGINQVNGARLARALTWATEQRRVADQLKLKRLNELGQGPLADDPWLRFTAGHLARHWAPYL